MTEGPTIFFLPRECLVSLKNVKNFLMISYFQIAYNKLHNKWHRCGAYEFLIYHSTASVKELKLPSLDLPPIIT